MKRLGHYYMQVSTVMMSAVLIFAVLNLLPLLADVVIGFLGSDFSDPVQRKYGAADMRLYPGYTREQVDQILQASWSRKFVYEPFTQFREQKFESPYVNITEAGFRVSRHQGPWPPDAGDHINVFMFGGSTLFGYGVADNDTIASHLSHYANEDQIAVRVYNFGRGGYYSTQERILFEKLLSAGITPDAAVFLDGLNEFYHFTDEPDFTARIRQRLTAVDTCDVGKLVRKLPLVKTALALGVRGKGPSSAPQEVTDKQQTPAPQDVFTPLFSRFCRNKDLTDAVAAAHHINVLHVWQPVPVYQYDQRYHPFRNQAQVELRGATLGYPVFVEKIRTGICGPNLVSLADMQASEKKPLYVDLCHYTPEMSRQVAQKVYLALKERNLLKKRQATPKEAQ